MPGYQPPPPDPDAWKAEQAAVMAAARKMTPAERLESDNNAAAFQARQAVVEAARARGASREEIQRIMEGR